MKSAVLLFLILTISSCLGVELLVGGTNSSDVQGCGKTTNPCSSIAFLLNQTRDTELDIVVQGQVYFSSSKENAYLWTSQHILNVTIRSDGNTTSSVGGNVSLNFPGSLLFKDLRFSLIITSNGSVGETPSVIFDHITTWNPQFTFLSASPVLITRSNIAISDLFSGNHELYFDNTTLVVQDTVHSCSTGGVPVFGPSGLVDYYLLVNATVSFLNVNVLSCPLGLALFSKVTVSDSKLKKYAEPALNLQSSIVNIQNTIFGPSSSLSYNALFITHARDPKQSMELVVHNSTFISSSIVFDETPEKLSFSGNTIQDGYVKFDSGIHFDGGDTLFNASQLRMRGPDSKVSNCSFTGFGAGVDARYERRGAISLSHIKIWDTSIFNDEIDPLTFSNVNSISFDDVSFHGGVMSTVVSLNETVPGVEWKNLDITLSDIPQSLLKMVGGSVTKCRSSSSCSSCWTRGGICGKFVGNLSGQTLCNGLNIDFSRDTCETDGPDVLPVIKGFSMMLVVIIIASVVGAVLLAVAIFFAVRAFHRRRRDQYIDMSH